VVIWCNFVSFYACSLDKLWTTVKPDIPLFITMETQQFICDGRINDFL